MKFTRSLACLLLSLGSSAQFALAGPIVPLPDLFNTGVNASGVPQADNTPDIHYVFATPPPTGTVPIVTTSANGFPIPPWLGDSATSAWLTPSLDTTGDIGNYTYRTTFNIPAGVDLSQVFINGRLSSDNTVPAVRLNGVDTGITGSGNFGAFDPGFTIQRGFVTGVNTLDFVVNEATGAAGNGGYTGLRVEMTGARGPVGQVAIPGLSNTGVTAPEGLPLPDNTVDPHYTLTGSISGPAIVATSTGGFPIPPWAGDNTSSAWVVPASDTNGPEGDYFYDLTFDMTGLNIATAAIFGRWAVDNLGTDILLNGVSTGNVNNDGFADFTTFSISPQEGDVFLPGLNTLRFQVFNAPPAGPTGLRVEFLSSTAAPVPEPSVAMLAFAGAGMMLRRRRR